MTQDKDIVEDIFHRVKNILGKDFTGEVMLKLEKEEEKVRFHWGGCEIYVAKKRNMEKIKSELIKGTPICDVPRKTGISRAQVYRLLKKN